MTRSEEAGRPVPPGIITEDYTEDEEIGLLNTGKEADVFLVRRHGRDRACLLAAKRYRPVEHRGFRNDAIYRAHRRIDGLVRDGDRWRRPMGGRGTQKAMDQRSDYGKKVLAGRWIDAEHETLTALWTAGAPVPYPVGRLDDGILMEFVGDDEQAAPRLVDVRVDRAELPDLFDQLRGAMVTFVRAGIVHATDLLHHDVMTMCAWFMRKGLGVDAEQLFVELVNEAFDLQMRDLFLAGG